MQFSLVWLCRCGGEHIGAVSSRHQRIFYDFWVAVRKVLVSKQLHVGNWRSDPVLQPGLQEGGGIKLLGDFTCQ